MFTLDPSGPLLESANEPSPVSILRKVCPASASTRLRSIRASCQLFFPCFQCHSPSHSDAELP